MKRRITGYLLALAFFLAVWFLFGTFQREPRYDGKTVDEWRWALNFPETRDRALDALLHLGTNQTPEIIRGLRAHDSPFKQKWINFSLVPAYQRQRQAIDALSNLGPGARAALPALTNLLHDPDRDVVQGGIEAVRYAGGNAVPSLLSLLSDTNAEVRASALFALGNLCKRADYQDPEVLDVVLRGKIARAILPYFADSNPQVDSAAVYAAGQIRGVPEIVIPAFLSALTNRNFNMRYYAVQNIVWQGTDARPAVPLVLQLLKDPMSSIREAATNTLLKIAPEAAASAGIK